MTIILPNTLSNSDNADADAIQANFDALANRLGAISNADLAADAGIALEKLASRYSFYEETIPLLHWSGSADYNAVTDYGDFTTAFQDLMRWRKRVPTGKNVFLVELEFYVAAVSGVPGIEVQLVIDSTVVGQAIPLTISGRYYTIGNSSLFSAPLQQIADQSVLQAQIRQDVVGSGDCRGLSLRLTWKVEHVE